MTSVLRVGCTGGFATKLSGCSGEDIISRGDTTARVGKSCRMSLESPGCKSRRALRSSTETSQLSLRAASFLGGSPLRVCPARLSKRASWRGSKQVSARAEGPGGENPEGKLAPLEPESPAGQLLVQLLKSHPHLFAAAAEEQLERLVEEREQQEARDEEAAKGQDLVLYKRISDIRGSERRRAIEEVIYALIVERFRDVGVALVPQIPFLSADTLTPNTMLISLGSHKDKALMAVHSEEAREMVLEHLEMILGGRPAGTSAMMDDRILVQTSKVRMGQVYAASIMYGYFLRRVDLRFQLEKTMKMLAEGGEVREAFEATVAEENGAGAENGAAASREIKSTESAQGKEEASEQNGRNFEAEFAAAAAALSSNGGAGDNGNKGVTMGGKIGALRSYVQSFDQHALQQAATMRSSEGINVIEKHTEALFGKPQVAMSPDGGLAVTRDEEVRVTISTLRRSILEAVAFGSFLWDVESYVDTRYKITQS